ncbi:MAG: hypothetical protein RBT63_11635 [Bdellovibrionales bacterium]|jgi:hypothetical protein|nr:hypothetical protein [Bdellovibrionales bacterium]
MDSKPRNTSLQYKTGPCLTASHYEIAARLNHHYYLSLTFSSQDPKWAEGYLENSTHRLTYILRDLRNEFWENFAKSRQKTLASNQLLLRTKHVDHSNRAVVLSQLYRDESGYQDFLYNASPQHDLAALLAQHGISTKRYDACVPRSFGPELLASVVAHPHIIQYLQEAWRTPDLKIGDPLKQGRLYLPNPEET